MKFYVTFCVTVLALPSTAISKGIEDILSVNMAAYSSPEATLKLLISSRLNRVLVLQTIIYVSSY